MVKAPQLTSHFRLLQMVAFSLLATPSTPELFQPRTLLPGVIKLIRSLLSRVLPAYLTCQSPLLLPLPSLRNLSSIMSLRVALVLFLLQKHVFNTFSPPKTLFHWYGEWRPMLEVTGFLHMLMLPIRRRSLPPSTMSLKLHTQFSKF
jgi:hypothetical protein